MHTYSHTCMFICIHTQHTHSHTRTRLLCVRMCISFFFAAHPPRHVHVQPGQSPADVSGSARGLPPCAPAAAQPPSWGHGTSAPWPCLPNGGHGLALPCTGPKRTCDRSRVVPALPICVTCAGLKADAGCRWATTVTLGSMWQHTGGGQLALAPGQLSLERITNSRNSDNLGPNNRQAPHSFPANTIAVLSACIWKGFAKGSSNYATKENAESTKMRIISMPINPFTSVSQYGMSGIFFNQK